MLKFQNRRRSNEGQANAHMWGESRISDQENKTAYRLNNFKANAQFRSVYFRFKGQRYVYNKLERKIQVYVFKNSSV
jgi:hypothetical protein